MNITSDIENIKIGFQGEAEIRNFFKASSIRFMQLDMVINFNGSYYSVEAKHQEYYTSPPFDGHGLPPWQVKARIELYNKTNIIPLFIVKELNTDTLYINDLITLDMGEQALSKTGNRILYPLTSFLKYNVKEEDYIMRKAMIIINERFKKY